MIKQIILFDYGVVTSGYITAVAEAPVAPDTFGVKWGLFDCDGWDGGVDVRQAVFDRPNADGVAYDEFHYAPRVMEIRGGLVAPSRRIAAEAVRRLKASFALHDTVMTPNGLKYLLVDEYAPNHASGGGDVGSFFTFCRRAGKIDVRPAQYGTAYEWSVPVICPDPLKYAVTQLHNTKTNFNGGPLVVTSEGTMPVLPEFILSGPITNPVITHDRTGWFMAFQGALGAGQSVGWNAAGHSAGGTLNRSNLVAGSRWFPVLPGVNNYTLTGGTGPTGATQFECFWYDGYD